MMALIGFFALLVIGTSFVIAGICMVLMSLGFGGRIELLPTAIFCGGGSVILYLAVKYSPIAVSWSVA